MACGCGGSSPGDAVGLLDQGDGDSDGLGGLAGGAQIGCGDSAAGAVTEYETGDRCVDGKQLRSGEPVRSLEFEDPASLLREGVVHGVAG